MTKAAPKAAKVKRSVPGVPEGTKAFKQRLLVPLTDEEIGKKSNKAAKVQDDVDALRVKMNESTKNLKVEIKEKTAVVRQLLRDIGAGAEERDVVCYEDRDFKASVVRTIRADTGIEVSNRIMDAIERQEQLKPKNGKGADGDPWDAPAAIKGITEIASDTTS